MAHQGLNNAEFLKLVQHLYIWFKLKRYKGIDPYLLDEKAFKFMKKMPIIKYIRKLLKPLHSFIPKKVFESSKLIYHPKAVGLIIGSNSMLFSLTNDDIFLSEMPYLMQLLNELRSSGYHHFCWGHPFEWGQQPRYPKNTPAVCVTTPIAHGLLDYYTISKDKETLEICESVANYLLEENGYDEIDNHQISLYYSPLDRKYAYNSDIMAASFLYRLAQNEKNDNYINFAHKLVNFVINAQKADGSWIYADSRGEQEIKTIDNRHTGFVLEALSIIYKISHDKQIKKSLENGIDYYLHHLFNNELPKWSPAQTFPIDIHDVGQAIITLTEIGEYEKAKKIIQFAIEKMSNGKDEFYYKYFESGRVNTTVFFRWGQAWMYRALTKYLYESNPH